MPNVKPLAHTIPDCGPNDAETKDRMERTALRVEIHSHPNLQVGVFGGDRLGELPPRLDFKRFTMPCKLCMVECHLSPNSLLTMFGVGVVLASAMYFSNTALRRLLHAGTSSVAILSYPPHLTGVLTARGNFQQVLGTSHLTFELEVATRTFPAVTAEATTALKLETSQKAERFLGPPFLDTF